MARLDTAGVWLFPANGAVGATGASAGGLAGVEGRVVAAVVGGVVVIGEVAGDEGGVVVIGDATDSVPAERCASLTRGILGVGPGPSASSGPSSPRTSEAPWSRRRNAEDRRRNSLCPAFTANCPTARADDTRTPIRSLPRAASFGNSSTAVTASPAGMKTSRSSNRSLSGVSSDSSSFGTGIVGPRHTQSRPVSYTHLRAHETDSY